MFQAQNRETKLVIEKLLCPPRSLWRRAWQDCISQHNTKPPRPRPIFFGLRPVLSRDRRSQTTSLVWEALWAPSGVQGGALAAQRFFTISSLRMASS